MNTNIHIQQDRKGDWYGYIGDKRVRKFEKFKQIEADAVAVIWKEEADKMLSEPMRFCK